MTEHLYNLKPFEPLDERISKTVWSQPIDDLKLLGRLGKGASADVWRVKRAELEGEFAAKILNKRLLRNTEEAVINEARLTRKLRHKHVLRCYGIYESEDDKVYVIIYELAEGGSLLERIQRVERFSEKDAAHIIKQIAEALKYIHGKNIMHRDIKLENIFLKNSSKPSSPLSKDVILLGDFGFAYESEDNKASTILGSLLFIAPEVICSAEYTEKVDIWALGVITYGLLSGMPLFYGNNKSIALQVVEKPIHLIGEEWTDISDDAKDFIHHCLNRDPQERITAEAALKHKWLVKYTNIKSASDFKALDAWRKGILKIMEENRKGEKIDSEVVAHALSHRTYKKELGSQPPKADIKVPGKKIGGGQAVEASRNASETAEGSNMISTKRRETNQPPASAARSNVAASSSQNQNTAPDPAAPVGTVDKKRSKDGNQPKGKKRREE